jgi:4-hydroxybenzoate polyprenyltransferase
LLERLNDLASFLRVRDWIKNTFLLVPIVFSGELFNPRLETLAWLGFLDFCLLSSAVYILNDIIDLERDKKHPVKMKRALPSGRVSTTSAWILFAMLSLFSFVLAFALGRSFGLTALVYFLLNVAYTFQLKNIVILDVFSIAAGFVIRIFAGAFVIDVEPSEWLLICSFLLSLFLALCKRRRELVVLEYESGSHRSVLDRYTPLLLDQMIPVVTSACVISYILYTISPATVEKFGTKDLLFTFPLVVYGIFRYLYLVYRMEKGGSPAETLLTDMPLLITVFLWLFAAAVIIY